MNEYDYSELQNKVQNIITEATAGSDLGVRVLWPDNQPADAQVYDQRPPLYWTEKIMQLFTRELEKREREARIDELDHITGGMARVHVERDGMLIYMTISERKNELKNELLQLRAGEEETCK